MDVIYVEGGFRLELSFTCSGVVVRFLSAGWEVYLLSARVIL